jgi:hypothetical protein
MAVSPRFCGKNKVGRNGMHVKDIPYCRAMKKEREAKCQINRPNS